MAVTIDTSCLGDSHTTHSLGLRDITSGYVPLTTTTAWPVNTSPKLNNVDYLRYCYNDVIATETLVKTFKNEKEKKEMANAKVCDICGAVYSTKKYTKIFDDMDDKYDIHFRFFDSCSNDIEICPDCYKALIDKLVERGLEPVEEDDEKKDDD